MVRKNLILALCLVLFLLSLTACKLVNIASTSSNTDKNTENSDTSSGENTDTSDTEIGDKDTSDNDSELEDTPQGYFLATIVSNENVVPSPYTEEEPVPEELKGLYYSAKTPGGKPRNDGTGKIWLELKPLKNTYINEITIEGAYDSIENIGLDLYCINGVKSDLVVSTKTTYAPSTEEKLFKDYGYGISDDGTLILTWEMDEATPIRYIEISYTNENGYFLDYIEPTGGNIELFNMTENKIYTASMRAVGEKSIGKYLNIKCSYMKEPKEINFPRIEITTENFVWPSCDFVGSPSGCWGAGITNAFYEKCTMTLYNKDNVAVYSSTQNETQGKEFDGAKLKIRGNTSARYASNSRFPYKLKLDDAYDLLAPLGVREESKVGYADRDWVLLNYGNEAYRVCGDAIADAVGTAWSPDYTYVSLYLNGDYRGIYVLSEAVEEGNGTGNEQGRVNVDNDGFVFECDAYWWNEDLSLSTPLTENTPMHFTFKHPDPDGMDESSPEYIYLKNYLTEFEEALMRDDDSYLDYIDLDSFVRWLLVSDYLCINDGGGSNLFLYKKDSSSETKICMGPNWDFDSYMGSVDGLAVIRLTWDTAPFYYQYLIKKDSFDKRYRELFNETYGNLTPYIDEAFDKIDTATHTQLLAYDNQRFGTSTTTLLTRKQRFTSWLSEHLAWMETQFK